MWEEQRSCLACRKTRTHFTISIIPEPIFIETAGRSQKKNHQAYKFSATCTEKEIDHNRRIHSIPDIKNTLPTMRALSSLFSQPAL